MGNPQAGQSSGEEEVGTRSHIDSRPPLKGK